MCVLLCQNYYFVQTIQLDIIHYTFSSQHFCFWPKPWSWNQLLLDTTINTRWEVKFHMKPSIRVVKEDWGTLLFTCQYLNMSLFSQSYISILCEMELCNFLWLMWSHYLPLPPIWNHWPPRPHWPPPGGTPISTTVHKTNFFSSASILILLAYLV